MTSIIDFFSQLTILLVIVFLALFFVIIAYKIRNKESKVYKTALFLGYLTMGILLFSFYALVKKEHDKEWRAIHKDQQVIYQEYQKEFQNKIRSVIANRKKVYFANDNTLRTIDSISKDSTLLFSDNRVFRIDDLKFID